MYTLYKTYSNKIRYQIELAKDTEKIELFCARLLVYKSDPALSGWGVIVLTLMHIPKSLAMLTNVLNSPIFYLGSATTIS